MQRQFKEIRNEANRLIYKESYERGLSDGNSIAAGQRITNPYNRMSLRYDAWEHGVAEAIKWT